MIALQITSMKQFMNQLLTSDTFDMFLLEEAVISTSCTFTIDGHINRDFYGSEGGETVELPYEFRPWSEVKGLCFDLIKGKRTPLFFRFVLHLMPEKAAALLSKEGSDVEPSLVKALVLNIRYDGAKAVLTTATAYQTFLLSKEPDAIWDKALMKYLEGKGIPTSFLT
ncbi:MAG: hypothetical protein HFH05_03400 [Lachnospiraceae bacterium]|jgi:hypothetical protein|nr:hypothetical protein [Lachnospiraceae bacterium]MCI9676228.1 hypothetical protein [Lachnospiraceae bacterium]